MHRYNARKLLYRYGVVCCVTITIVAVWRYGCYQWLNMHIQQQQITISQLQQQIAEQLLLLSRQEALLQRLPTLKNACIQGTTCCIGAHCYDQSTYIFTELQKAGLHMVGYHTAPKKEKNKWHESHHITVSLHGTLDQLVRFLTALQISAKLVQCTSLSLQQMEDKKFTIESTIQFIVYKI